MKFLLYMAVAAFAFFLGRTFAIRRKVSQTTKDEFKEMREKANQKKRERVKDRKQAILEQAQKQGRITNDEAENMFCISDSTASNYLDQLEKEGKLKQVGKSGRGVYYIPAKNS